MAITQIELNAKWNREDQARKARHRAEDQADYARQRAEQEAFDEARKGAQNEAQVDANMAIEKRVDELRPLDASSPGAWVTRNERQQIRRYLRGELRGALNEKAVEAWVVGLAAAFEKRKADAAAVAVTDAAVDPV